MVFFSIHGHVLFIIGDKVALGFPGSSAGKKSACNAGDSTSIPKSGRSPGEERGYPPTLVFMGFPGGSDGKESACSAEDLSPIPGREDPLEEGMATHSSIFAWRIPMDRGAWWDTILGVSKSRTQLSD